ncbi:MAG: hypothetical protein AAF361_13640, partial [Bacteroidota bacterium]
SLIRQWERLQDWVLEESQSAKIFTRLADTARLHAKGDAGYYRDPQLQLTLNWEKQEKPNASWANRYHTGYKEAVDFLHASQWAAKKRTWGVWGGVISVLVILAGMALFSNVQRQNAIDEAIAADSARAEAVRQAAIADTARIEASIRFAEAEQARTEATNEAAAADLARRRASFNEKIAVDQARLADSAKAAAERSEEFANYQAERARISAENVRLESTRAKSLLLASTAEIVAENTDHTQALRIAEAAYGLMKEDSPLPVKRALLNIQQKGITYQVKFDQGDLIKSATFSPDGNLVLTHSNNQLARVWSTTGKLEAILDHEEDLTNAMFSPTGKIILTTSNNQSIIWNLKGEKMKVLQHPQQDKKSSFSDDVIIRQNTLFGGDPLMRCYNTSASFFSLDGERILTCSDTQKIKLWNLKGDEIATLTHDEEIQEISFSSDGELIMVVSYFAAGIWDRNGNKLTVLKHKYGIEDASFSPDSKKILTVSNDRARLWAINGNQLTTLKQKRDLIISATFSPDGQRIVTTSLSGLVQIWSLKGAKLRSWYASEFFASWETPLNVFSPDENYILIDRGQNRYIDVETLDYHRFGTIYHNGEKIEELVFSPDGTQILTRSNSMVRIWNIKGQELFTLEHQTAIQSASFSSQRGKILTSSGNSAKLWDITKRDGSQSLTHKRPIYTALLSTDDKKILTYSADAVSLWSIDEGELNSIPFSRLIDALFSPSGQFFLALSAEGNYSIWNANGEQIAIIELPDNRGSEYFAFSSDDKHILGSFQDSTVI